jgi:hypothetical protein
MCEIWSEEVSAQNSGEKLMEGTAVRNRREEPCTLLSAIWWLYGGLRETKQQPRHDESRAPERRRRGGAHRDAGDASGSE